MNARAVVPDFELPATGNPRFRLPAFHGHPLVASLASHARVKARVRLAFAQACAASARP